MERLERAGDLSYSSNYIYFQEGELDSSWGSDVCTLPLEMVKKEILTQEKEKSSTIRAKLATITSLCLFAVFFF